MKDINLLPEDIKTSSVRNEQSKSGISVKVIVAIAFVVVVLGFILFIPKLYLKTIEMKCDAIQKEIESDKYKEVKEVNAKLSEINGILDGKKVIINSIDNSFYPLSEVLSAINSLSPDGCTLSSFSFNGSSITISGKVASDMQIAELVSKVNRLSFIDGANATRNVNIAADNSFTYTFGIVRKDGK